MTGLNPVWTNQKDLCCLLGYCQLNVINLHLPAFIMPLLQGGNAVSALKSVTTSYASKHGIQSKESESEISQHRPAHSLSRHKELSQLQMKATGESVVLSPPLSYSYSPHCHFSDPDRRSLWGDPQQKNPPCRKPGNSSKSAQLPEPRSK